jgi:hypothetical protein
VIPGAASMPAQACPLSTKSLVTVSVETLD